VNATKTAPAGAMVPAAIRGVIAHDDPGALAGEAIDAAMKAAKIAHHLGEENERLRAELKAARDESAALRKHIEQMAVLT